MSRRTISHRPLVGREHAEGAAHDRSKYHRRLPASREDQVRARHTQGKGYRKTVNGEDVDAFNVVRNSWSKEDGGEAKTEKILEHLNVVRPVYQLFRGEIFSLFT